MNEDLKKLMVGSAILGGVIGLTVLLGHLVVISPGYIPYASEPADVVFGVIIFILFLIVSYVIGNEAVGEETERHDEEAEFWDNFDSKHEDPSKNFKDLKTEHAAEKENER